MPFRHKRHRVRLGLPETILGAMLLLALLPAAAWVGRGHGAHRHRTVAALTSAAYARPSSPGRDGDLMLGYRYTVAGRDYGGRWPVGPVGRQALLTLAPELRRLLAEQGIEGFDDIPEDVRVVLASRQITGFDAIPAALVDKMRARGYRNPDDLPPGLRDALARGDHADAARRLDALLPQPQDRETSAAARVAGTRRVTLRPEPRGPAGPMPTLYVFYNPADPARHDVSLFPWRTGSLLLVLSGAAMAVALTYGLWGYPRLVALRPR